MNKQDIETQLGGCFLAVPALYNDDQSLNLAGMRQHVHFLIEHGLNVENSVVLINGATGEFPVLTTAERKQTLETAVEAAGGKIAIIAGAQTSSTREAVEIAQHAQACGVAAVQVSPPFYYPPTDDDVFEHFAAIGSAAPKLGIVAYNTPTVDCDVHKTPEHGSGEFLRRVASLLIQLPQQRRTNFTGSVRSAQGNALLHDPVLNITLGKLAQVIREEIYCDHRADLRIVHVLQARCDEPL